MLSFFEKLVDPYADYDQADTPPSKLFPFLLEYVRPFKGVLIATVFSVVITGIIEVGLIYYTGRVVDLLTASTPQTFLADHGRELIWVALFILIVRPVFHILDSALLHQSMLTNLGTLVRWRSHRHVLRQSVGWFENDFAGRLANRIMQTAPATGEAVFQVFDALVYSAIYVVGAFFLLAEIGWQLTLPLVIWFAAYFTLMRWAIPRVGRASKAVSDARSTLTGRIVDSYTNIQSVKLFAHHQTEEDYARDAIEATRKTFQKEMRYVTLMEMWLTLINGLLIVVVIGWSINLWMNDQASIGVVAAASALTLRLGAMTGWIMWSLSSLFQHLGVIAEGMETIAQPISLVDRIGARALEVGRGEIVFDRVRHHYGKDAGGLSDVSITVQGGQKIGLIGRSGAGKSTLVNLLLRFHDLEGGAIRIDGQSIDDVTQDSLRSHIGMVTQDSSLLHRTVRENILYGRPGASEAEMIKAARQAEAHDFILGLEDPNGNKGYDAEVGERGVKLSGGQRQRVALARVIVKDAPLLVLDEATSALDSEVEAAIQKTLYGVMEGKTVIAIAHRLSTIARMDRIIVLDGGRVAEEGTHAELLATGGLYSRFWERQSGGFIGLEASE